MSQENVEIVREATEAFNRDGVDGLIKYCDPAIEWHTTGRFADQGVYRAHDGVRKLFAELGEDLEDMRSHLEYLGEAGGQVVATTVLTGRGRRGAVPVEQRLSNVIRLKDGKVTEIRQFARAEDALAAAGLSE